MTSRRTRKKPAPPTLDLQPHQVVLEPIISEKCTHLVEHHNTYAFRVSMLATKDMIRSAVEDLFDVKVIDVRTEVRPGKPRRFKMRMSRTADWKKAYVKLSEKDRIALF